MRVRVSLDLNNIKIPISYHSLLQGVIYHSLEANDKTSRIHDDGYCLDNRKFKLFTFSELYGQTIFLKETKELQFFSNACFDFTSFEEDMLMTFIDFLNQNNGIVIGNKKCGIVEYKILDDNVYNEEGIEYYTLSPITAYRTIENKKTEYLSPDSSDFRDYIISNLAKKYYLCFHENMDEIDIIDISNVKKKIVKFRKTFVISYHMRIKFGKLNTKIQKVILTCGLGGKNSYGLGMVSKRVR